MISQTLFLSARAVLSVIGYLSTDVVKADEDHEILKEQLIERAMENRIEQEQTGEYDNYANLQPLTAPDLRVDMLLNYRTDDCCGKVILQWSQGIVNIFQMERILLRNQEVLWFRFCVCASGC